jgi:predicted KAP-like P-loop ATPase
MRWLRRRREDVPSAKPSQPAGTLHADAPITSEEEDRLGRAPFARRLARQLELAPADGFVAALTGPWGSGKTSVLRLVADALAERAEGESHDVVIVEFNPWLFSGSEQLVSQFFEELADALPRQLGRKRGTRAAERLRSYASALRTLENAPGVGWLFQSGAAFMDEAGRRVDQAPASLREGRKLTTQALSSLEARIVVIVDDVDRLQDDEIRTVMRMIKLVGDFPNVTYLLAFDRHLVEQALGTNGIDGLEYLEKIIQLEYQLPEVAPEKLDALLVEEVQRAIHDVPDARFDLDRWEPVYRRIVNPLVQRPRHIRRFANALPLALELAEEEVDPVDVLALTAVQTLLPRLHRSLPRLRDDLVPPMRYFSIFGRNEDKEESASRLREAATESGNPAVALAVFDLLFPDTGLALKNAHFGDDERASWKRRRRVAEGEAFDHYLTATLPEGAVSAADVRGAIRAFASPEQLESVLAARKPAEVAALVQRLLAQLDEIPTEHVEAALPVLEVQEDRLRSDETADPWAPSRRVRALILLLMGSFPRGPERDDLLRRRFSATSSLWARFRWVRDASQKGDDGRPLFADETLSALRRSVIAAILESSADQLLAEEKPGWLLRVAEDDEAGAHRDRVREVLEDGRLLPAYLSTFLEFGTTSYVLRVGDVRERHPDSWLREVLERAPHPADETERDALQQLRDGLNEVR